MNRNKKKKKCNIFELTFVSSCLVFKKLCWFIIKIYRIMGMFIIIVKTH